MVRNIYDNEALAKIAENSHTQTKVGSQFAVLNGGAGH